MSISNHVYLGWYLEVESQPIQKQVNRWTCPEHSETSMPKTSKFCDACGSPLQNMTFTFTEDPSRWEVLPERYEDAFFCPEYFDEGKFIFLVNYDDSGALQWEQGQVDAIEITDDLKASLYREFQTRYASVLTSLEAEINFSVKFGLVHYCS